MVALDHMFLHGIEAHGWHGVFDFERAAGQRFVVDVDWWLDTSAAVRDDSLNSSLCYKQLYDAVIGIIVGEPWALIETLADRVASELFDRFAAIMALQITVHKPEAPMGGPFADVGITLSRSQAWLYRQDLLPTSTTESLTMNREPLHEIRSHEIRSEGFFTRRVGSADPAVAAAMARELRREQDQIELIASENIVSQAVLDAQGSVFTNKYAEGYPGKRYYQGCAPSDEVEQLAIDRAKQLFNCGFVNVQPHSGAQANGAVMLALTKPGDTIMGLSLDAGGHLTHGAKPALSGKWFNAVQYGVCEDTHLIDYDQVEALAKQHQPTLIIAGGSAYPRHIDFARFRAIADQVGAVFMVDMAHFAGLVAGGVHPTPFGHAHVVTTTTHKTLRGPRGGMVLTDDEAIAKKINSAVFPGLQGGPLMHVIAAKAVALGEALQPEFSSYAKAVVSNAKALAGRLEQRGLAVVSGGTDTHLALIDLRPYGISGKDADEALERSHITCNKNGVPGDPLPPTKTSGIRVGSPAGTTRGFGVGEFEAIGDMIADVLAALRDHGEQGDPAIEATVRARVAALTTRFPIYAEC